MQVYSFFLIFILILTANNLKVHIVYLSTGSNLGEKYANLLAAKQNIEKCVGRLVQASSIYVSEPWGFNSEELFYNQVLSVSTNLSAQEVLKEIQNIELLMGRIKTEQQWSSRIIDIDILFYDSIKFQSETLTIPHPFIQERKFVLLPLSEISPVLIHPVLYKSTAELLLLCKDLKHVELLKSQNS